MQTPTLHQAHAAFDEHDAFLYAILGVASALRKVTELVERAAARVPEHSGERSAGVPDGPVLDALLGLVALQTTTEKVLGDMSAVERARSGRKTPRGRRSGNGGLLR